jgi:RNA polymerase sigma-70 factor (ECF subfamily)
MPDAATSPATSPATARPRVADDPESWVDAHGDSLFAYATSRLRSASRADDLVQETFLAALKSHHRFEGRSNTRTWLIGILRNKILDHFRKASREQSFTDLDFYADEEDDRFHREGPFVDGWIHERGPKAWKKDRIEAMDRDAFWKTFDACLIKLPPNVARVFALREMDDIESAEICDILNVTQSNLWVMLHRARMALRRCLENNWFAHSDAEPPQNS